MKDNEWEYFDIAMGLNTSRLCLVDDILFNIVGDETTPCLWSKMESLYMTKSLTK
jgi:hypothetical protein